MTNRRLLAVGILLAFGTLAAPAAAQRITSPFEFVDGKHAFYTFGSTVFTDRGTLDTGPGSGYAGGLGYGFRVSGPFVLEVRAAYFPTDRRVYNDTSTFADSTTLRADPTFGLEQVGTADMELVLLDASLRFNLTGPRTWYLIQPYALIGAGGALVASQARTGEDQIEEDSQLLVRFRNGFTGHVGGGVELHLSDHFTVRADARDLLWKLHLPEGFRTTGRVIDDEQWVQTAHLSLGVVIRF